MLPCRAAMSVEFWLVSGRQMLNPIPGGVTGLALWFYRLTCLVLNSLNAMWFVKMVQVWEALFFRMLGDLLLHLLEPGCQVPLQTCKNSCRVL